MLEVVKYRDLVGIKELRRFVPGAELPTLEIIGEDFTNVEEVRINEVTSPEFIIISKTVLWAVLPVGAREAISTVEVISSTFTKTSVASKLQFKIGTTSKSVSGILRLVQLFTKWMLQSPGSDIFNREMGGGLQDLVGKVTTTKGMEPVMSAIAQAIDRTVTQIRSAQLRSRGVPSTDERLLSAELVDFGIFEDKMEAQARVRIRAVSGAAAVTNLSL
jgi:phage baseplate assembly protein W